MRIIVCAADYVHSSAGITALYRVAKYLGEMGHEVWVSCPGIRPVPFGLQRISGEWNADLVIIPETIDLPSLPEKTRVARWVLNVPGKWSGPTKFAENEVVFFHRDDLVSMEEPAKAATSGGVVHEWRAGIVNGNEIWRVFRTQPRDIKTAFYFGKAPVYQPARSCGWLEVTRDWPPDRAVLFDILFRTEDFRTFDTYSAIIFEALTCGCRVWLPEWINGLPVWWQYNPDQSVIDSHLINEVTEKAALQTMLQIVFQAID